MDKTRPITDPQELKTLLGMSFSDEQLKAITAPLEPAVIIAGAGTGKTTVMAARVVWLVASGQVMPQEVLGLTFTRKAASELANRVNNALRKANIYQNHLADDEGEPVVMTYDAFANKLVSDYGILAGAQSVLRLISGAARFSVVSKIVKQASGPFNYLSRLSLATVAKRVLALAEQVQQNLLEPGQIELWAADFDKALDEAPLARGNKPYAAITNAKNINAERLELLSLVYEYQRAKQEAGITEFADNLALAAKIASDIESVGNDLRSKFQVVLLDEYQDTSSAQAKLLSSLFSSVKWEAGLGFAVTAVGDPYQAIYGWRGAAASNILQFAQAFPLRDGKPAATYRLSINRRSDSHILRTANALAASLKADERLTVKDSQGNPLDMALKPRENASEGLVQVAKFADWPAEVNWIADEIAASHDRADITAWSDIAVLVRRNSELQAFYQELTSRDIPVEIVGLGGLLSLQPIIQIVAMLRLLDDVTYNPAVIQLLSESPWCIGVRDLAALGKYAQQLAGYRQESSDIAILEKLQEIVEKEDQNNLLCLMDAVADPPLEAISAQAYQRLKQFITQFNLLREYLDEPLNDLVNRVINVMGVVDEIKANEPAQIHQINQFLEAISQYIQSGAEASLSGLLAWFDVENEFGEGLDQATITQDNSVKLLTIHKAKGLEWKIVFLPRLIEGVFPNLKVNDDWVRSSHVLPSDLRGDADWAPSLDDLSNSGLKTFHDELLKTEQKFSEDRLAYVAASRAAKRLVVTTHCARIKKGEKFSIKPTPYFDIIARNADETLASVDADNITWPQQADIKAQWPKAIDFEKQAIVKKAAQLVMHQPSEELPLSFDEEQQVQLWNRNAELLVAQAKERSEAVTNAKLPISMAASAYIRLTENPKRFRAELLRPMPMPVNSHATIGSRFHKWLEERFNLKSVPDEDYDEQLTSDELAQANLDSSQKAFEKLCEAFEAGPYANRKPEFFEEPFVLVLGGRQVRGRIDAIYRVQDGYQIVDWKTTDATPNKLQLAIYQQAWAEIAQISPEQIDAVFVHVASGRIERPRLPDRDELERLVAEAEENLQL